MQWMQSAAVTLVLVTSVGVAESTDTYRLIDGEQVLSVAEPNEAKTALPLADSERLQESDCAKTLGNKRTTQTKTVEDSAGSLRFVAAKPARSVAFIRSAGISGGRLELSFESQAEFIEYRAPTFIAVKETAYAAQPVAGVVTTTLLVGLPLLFTPKNVAYTTFGCTDRESTGKFLDLTKKKPTGKSHWLPYPQGVRVTVLGLGPPITFDTQIDEPAGKVFIELNDAIAKARLDGPSTLEVICDNCVLPDGKEAKRFGYLGGPVSATADFRSLQADLLERERARQAEEARMAAEEEDRRIAEAEREARRVLEEKLELERIRLAQESEAEQLRLEAQRRAAEQRRTAEAAEKERKQKAAKVEALREL